MSAAKQSTKDVTVTVAAPFQVCFEGVVHMPGDEVTVPPVVADDWRKSGWVT